MSQLFLFSVFAWVVLLLVANLTALTALCHCCHCSLARSLAQADEWVTAAEIAKISYYFFPAFSHIRGGERRLARDRQMQTLGIVTLMNSTHKSSSRIKPDTQTENIATSSLFFRQGFPWSLGNGHPTQLSWRWHLHYSFIVQFFQGRMKTNQLQ